MTARNRKNRKAPLSPQKKHLLIVLSIWMTVVFLSVLVSLIIGNHLKEKAKSLQNALIHEEFPIYEYSAEDVAPINAVLLDIYEKSAADVNRMISELPNDVRAVSLYLKRASGAMSYKSEVSEAVIGHSGGTLDLADIIEQLHTRGIYVSGCVSVSCTKVESDIGFDAALQYEKALINELLRFGVDELVITDLPSDSRGISRVSLLFSAVRNESDSPVILGAAIDYTTMLSNSGAFALKSYSSFADFCAIDTDGCRSAAVPPADIVRSLSYHFSAYPLRILVEVYGEADRVEIVSQLKSLGIQNIQAHKYAAESSLVG